MTVICGENIYQQMEQQINIGDRVRIISINKINELKAKDPHYWKKHGGMKIDGLFFNSEMIQYCGKTFIVSEKRNHEGQNRYNLEHVHRNAGISWHWNDAMLTLITPRIYGNELKD